MKLTVQFESQLQMVAGTRQLTIDVHQATSLSEAVSGIAEQNPPDLRERLLSEEGKIRPSLLVFINNQPIPSGKADTIELHEGDCISFYPPISGG